jgi:hypothetical protein
VIRRSKRTSPQGRKIVSTPERRPNSVSDQKDVSPSAPKRHPNIVSEQKGLPSSAPEQPPNDLNVARKPAPLDYQTPSKDRERKRRRTTDKAGTEDPPNELNVACNRNERLTPFSRSTAKVMPKKSEAVVVAQLNKTKAEWTRKASALVPGPASSTVRKSADRVETLLHVESDGDELTATRYSWSYSGELKVSRRHWRRDFERSTDRQIVDNVSAFWKHHNTKGRRSKVTQNALDAIVVAATFGSDSESVTALSNRLGIRTKSIESSVTHGHYMMSQGTTFVPSEAKQRPDCYRLPALKAVRAFCHSEEGGRDDTYSKRVYRVADPEDATLFRMCPPRLWHDIGFD